MIAELPTRMKQVATTDVARYATSQKPRIGNVVPNRAAFQGAKVLGRADGLFIFRIDLDPGHPFEPDDLDELAYVVSMVAKAKLGHTHFHHHLPGRGRPKPLKPTSVLVVPPVQLRPEGWDAKFEANRLSDTDLAGAITESAKAPPGEPGRHAVTCLRRNYLNLVEVLHYRLVMHRKSQLRRGPFTLRGAPTTVLGTSVAMAVLALAVSNALPMNLADIGLLLREMVQVPMVLAALVLGFGWSFLASIIRWHGPALNLLRSAHGFFAVAQPLNAIIGRLPVDGMVEGAKEHDFQAVLDGLASKIGGEENRISQQTTWLTLLLGVASLLVAIYAITDQRRNGDGEHGPAPSMRVTIGAISPPRSAADTAPPAAAKVDDEARRGGTDS